MSSQAQYAADYAKTGRATCRSCKQKISQGSLRMSRRAPSPFFDGLQDYWHHFSCFFERKKGFSCNDVKEIEGFEMLRPGDQQRLKDCLAAKSQGKRPAISAQSDGAAAAAPTAPAAAAVPAAAVPSAPPAKRRKSQKKDERATTAINTEEEREAALKQQSQQLWDFRRMLQNCSVPELRVMLEANDASSHGRRETLINRAAEGMLFGVLGRCKTCGECNWSYAQDGYHCNGNVSEWEPCDVITQTPPVKEWKVPKDVTSITQKKFKPKKRVFPVPEAASRKVAAAAATAATASVAAAMAASNADGGTGRRRSKRIAASSGIGPLSGLTLAIAGTVEGIETRIVALGGSVHSEGAFGRGSLHAGISFVVASKTQVRKKNAVIEEARTRGIAVVSTSFVAACEEQSRLAFHPSQLLVHEENKTAVAAVSQSNKLKLLVKGRSAVDPESDLQDTHHVLEEGSTVWNASLAMTDLRKGSNSYYKLQVLAPDVSGGVYLFRSWGRVGTSQGGNKVERVSSVSEATKLFQTLFTEKTGNVFGKPPYTKYPNKFYPLDISYGKPEEPPACMLERGTKTKLPRPVVDLVNLLFDMESMKKTLQELEIDMDKMPLGKLSSAHLHEAMAVLKELSDTLLSEADEGVKRRKILAASNKFYTFVPMNFGLRQPPPMDSLNLIKERVQMVEDLLSLEVASKMLTTGKEEAEEDPIDVYYKKLNTHMTPLERDSEMFEIIQKYIRNTHAETHRQYELEVEEVFELEREGEQQAFSKYKETVPHRRLLWHGSRLTNYAGILSQGLRIAPKEAPMTGYMFGKGIYFADMVSKSANYCFCSRDRNTGLLLLTEVALGDMYEKKEAEYVEKLPEGKLATKGIGRTQPDPKEEVALPDGTIVPLGKGTESGVRDTSLMYNEYIVYDQTQVKQRYLLRVKFNYG